MFISLFTGSILSQSLGIDQAKLAQPPQSAGPHTCQAACLFCLGNRHAALHAATQVERDPHVSKETHIQMSDATMTNPAIRNGVDTATLFATRDAIKADPEL